MAFHLTGTEVATGAATLAFLGSMVSVKVNSRTAKQLHQLSAGREEQRWARQEIRPLLSRLLASADTLVWAWRDQAYARAEWLRWLTANRDSNETKNALQESIRLWEVAAQEDGKLGLLTAEFEVSASSILVKAALELHLSFQSMRHHQRGASPIDDPVETNDHDSNEVFAARSKLVGAARAELGLDPLG
jgi:hypothetical protein